MRRIIKAIKSLSDYLILLKKNPELLRPEQCSHCGAGGLWSHGSYDRKPDRNPGKGRSLNPTPVLRFYCHQCKRTCSTLPEILSPKRWYCWSVQSSAGSVNERAPGKSISSSGQEQGVSRHTVARWFHWLVDHFVDYSFHIKAHPLWLQLGRHSDPQAFWLACLGEHDLSSIMLFLNNTGVSIP